MFYFSISTDINSPFSHSAKVVRTLSSTLLQSYSRGSSTLIVAGMHAPSPACLFLWSFWTNSNRRFAVDNA